MSIRISGILKDGIGNPIPNCTIELKSKKTSLNVITKTEARLDLDITGSYSMNVEPCHYDVSLCIKGFSPKYVGDIHVYSDSRPGTLNDFLMMPEESDLTPEIILIFQQLRDEAKEAAESVISSAQLASESAESAKNSLTAAAESEAKADASAQLALRSAENAANSETAAAKSEIHAALSAQAASESSISAANSAMTAAKSESNTDISAQSADESATSAASSAVSATNSENSAATSALSASISATNAANSSAAATVSETNAGASAESASVNAVSAMNSAVAAAESQSNAEASAQSAFESAAIATSCASAAMDSETNAEVSATTAANEANKAKLEADRATAAMDSKQDKLDISELGKEIIDAEDVGTIIEILGITAQHLIPAWMPIPCPMSVPPEGYLKCNGAAFDKEKYPELAVGYPSGVLPDLRSEFIRGWDDSKGVDKGRALLSQQNDAIRNLTGGFASAVPSYHTRYATGVFGGSNGDNTSLTIDGAVYMFQSVTSPKYSDPHRYGFYFNASRQVPTAEENRPRNIAFNYIVRAA